MPKFPSLNGRQLLAFLSAQGFQLIRIRGSHHAMAKGQLTTVVPVHGSKTLKLGAIRGILQDMQMTPQEFVELWEKR